MTVYAPREARRGDLESTSGLLSAISNECSEEKDSDLVRTEPWRTKE